MENQVLRLLRMKNEHTRLTTRNWDCFNNNIIPNKGFLNEQILHGSLRR